MATLVVNHLEDLAGKNGFLYIPSDLDLMALLHSAVVIFTGLIFFLILSLPEKGLIHSME